MNTNEIARIAALVGEPARTAMLLELMGGRSLTANELAIAGNVLPQTASKHLSQLVDAGLLMVSQNGRHRYHRLASANVAKVLEGIMQLASLSRPSEGRKAIFGPRDAGMRRARTCYDHIAGRLGITITDRLLEQGAVVFDGDSGQVTDPAPYAMQSLGITLDTLTKADKRVNCRPCLDWSERRYHIAGRLGALICSHCLSNGWLYQRDNVRSLEITAKGAQVFNNWLGMDRWKQVI